MSTESRWLVLAVSLQSLGSGLTSPFLMIYLHEVRHIALGTAGLLVMMIGIAGLAVTIPCGYLIDRLGAWQVLVGGTVAMSASAVILAFASTPWAAALAFALAGLNLGVSQPAKNVLVALTTTGRRRRTMYALNFALLNLSWGLGGVVGGLYLDVRDARTFVAIFLFDAALMIAAAAVLVGPLRGLRRSRSPSSDGAGGRSFLSVLLSPGMMRFCLLTFLVTFIGYGQLESGIPVFARQVSEISTRAVGLAFSVNTLLIGTLQFWVLRRIDGHRRTRAIAVFGLVWAGAWAVLAATGTGPRTGWPELGFLLFVVAFAFGEMIMLPLLPVMTNDLASDQNRGRFNAFQSGAFQAGGIIGPAVAGFVLQHELNALYISLMTGGCLTVILVALTWERTIDPQVNGIEPESGHAPSASAGYASRR
ncbi:MFS transporter [Actinomadura nitritigenes]|uniref:MFS transporter n=1 Tax=Actinomadura nitritigenes TaxID=134602 RepID=UPI003D9168B2